MKLHFSSSLAKWLPKKFLAITLFSHVFFKQKQSEVKVSLLMHEATHAMQQEELGLKFYFIYLYEWVRNILKGQSLYEAYQNISFEIEAREFSKTNITGSKK